MYPVSKKMMINWNLMYSTFFTLILILYIGSSLCTNVAYLNPGEVKIVRNMNLDIPYIFCYKGVAHSLAHTWETLTWRTTLHLNQYKAYEGYTPDEVLEKYHEENSYWFNPYWWLSTSAKNHINVFPFNQTCLGISTFEDYYKMELHQVKYDYARIATAVSGILLFIFADSLSRNQIFYYVCGVLAGIFGSVLILAYFVFKLIPSKKLLYGGALVGSSMAFYFLRVLASSAKVLFAQYGEWIFSYVCASGFLSFLACYRFGPVTSERSMTIIYWILRIAALALVFWSSQLREVTFAMDAGLCFYAVFGKYGGDLGASKFWRKFKNRFVRPEIKFISEREYEIQGELETTKALTELKEYCSSPEGKPWKTVLKLKDPVSFAKFIDGEPHVSNRDVPIVCIRDDEDYDDSSDDNRADDVNHDSEMISSDDSDY